MQVRVRRAGPSDAPAAAAVLLASRQASVPAIPVMVHTDEESRSWLAALVEGGGVWVAEPVDAQTPGVVGVLVLSDGWIDQLYVGPDWMGNGIGSALVQHAKQCTPAGLALWTFQSNTGAQRFYTRHGFGPVERTDGSRNEERTPDVRMVWRSR